MKRGVALLIALLLAASGIQAFAAGEAATYTAYTTLDGASDGVVNNIRRAAAAVDGAYVPYGTTFSFNDMVGPRTKEYGYTSGVNGRGSEVIGGGVAQVATTMYLALLNVPGIYYTEVETYGSRFTGDYVSDGALAVVTDYEAGTDFRFENDADDLYLYAWIEGDWLYCSVVVGEYAAWADDSPSALIGYANIPLRGATGLQNNVARAANSISGATFSNGDTFSFNELVGPRTEEYGYVTAVNGRGVKVTGGGVAQVASVVWLAVKDLDDVTIVEKSTYGKNYNQAYVASANDAIVTDYNAGTDFSFRYTGAGSLIVYTYVSDGTLYCDIYEMQSGGLSW
ncbi:MAG: VanW family protein [Christensenellales bacterium]|jgi:vancomycin resistance protein YoaR